MAPFITKSTFRFHPSFSRFYAHLLSVRARIHRFPPAGLQKKLNPRQFAVPVAFFRPDDMGPGPETNPTSNTSNAGGGPLGTGAPPPPRHHLLATSLSHLNVWAYLALSVVILAVFAVLSYMIYSCYHTAGLRARMKPAVDATATSEIKGGWQTLGDVSADGETTVVERDEEAGEKTGDYVGEDIKRGMTGSWGKKRGLKGLGIQLRPQYDFTPYPKESQVSIISGSPHSTSSDRSLGSTSDHEHEQDLESSEGSDWQSLRTRPLAHTAEISAPYIRPMPLPLPLPLPLPVTPAPAQKQQVKQKRPRRLRALTQILTRHNIPQTQTQNQNGREMYFELEPMITRTGPSKFTLSEPLDQTPPSPSPPLSSRSKFAFFAPPSYPNCISTTTSSSNSTSNNSNSNATFSWGNHSSGSPTTFPTTPTTPLTPITPMTPVTPIKPRPGAVAAAVGLRFDTNNIQFIETPARNLDAGVGTSPPEIQAGNLAAVSLTRAEMLWNDPKLSPVQGAFSVDRDLPVSLDGATPAPAPALATPDQVHRGHPKSRLSYLRRGRGVSLSSPPSPSPSPSSSYCSSSDSVSSSPSLATARFILDREELKRDNLRNRVKKEKGREKEKENDAVKYLSPIPRPVFLPLPKPSTMLRAEQPFV